MNKWAGGAVIPYKLSRNKVWCSYSHSQPSNTFGRMAHMYHKRVSVVLQLFADVHRAVGVLVKSYFVTNQTNHRPDVRRIEETTKNMLVPRNCDFM